MMAKVSYQGLPQIEETSRPFIDTDSLVQI